MNSPATVSSSVSTETKPPESPIDVLFNSSGRLKELLAGKPEERCVREHLQRKGVSQSVVMEEIELFCKIDGKTSDDYLQLINVLESSESVSGGRYSNVVSSLNQIMISRENPTGIDDGSIKEIITSLTTVAKAASEKEIYLRFSDLEETFFTSYRFCTPEVVKKVCEIAIEFGPVFKETSHQVMVDLALSILRVEAESIEALNKFSELTRRFGVSSPAVVKFLYNSDTIALEDKVGQSDRLALADRIVKICDQGVNVDQLICLLSEVPKGLYEKRPADKSQLVSRALDLIDSNIEVLKNRTYFNSIIFVQQSLDVKKSWDDKYTGELRDLLETASKVAAANKNLLLYCAKVKQCLEKATSLKEEQTGIIKHYGEIFLAGAMDAIPASYFRYRHRPGQFGLFTRPFCPTAPRTFRGLLSYLARGLEKGLCEGAAALSVAKLVESNRQYKALAIFGNAALGSGLTLALLASLPWFGETSKMMISASTFPGIIYLGALGICRTLGRSNYGKR